jgi:D-amino peptidase
MKLYILCDMEGVSGIRLQEQVAMHPPGREYEHGRRLMMGDINAAVDGCFRGGASEVVVCDTHGMGGQVRVDEMDARAVYELPTGRSIMPALDESFEAVILLGHHAKAGTLNGFLEHTVSSRAWFRFTINGVEVGEIGIEAAYAGHFGVPVAMVSGDAACCDEAVDTLGPIETAVVKWGLSRQRARCLPVAKAYERIRDAAARAMNRLDSLAPFRPAIPATCELTYINCGLADERAFRGDVQRVDGRTVRKTIQSLAEIQWY